MVEMQTWHLPEPQHAFGPIVVAWFFHTAPSLKP